jgi:hypothetical protein
MQGMARKFVTTENSDGRGAGFEANSTVLEGSLE